MFIAALAFIGAVGYFLASRILYPFIASTPSQVVDVKTMTATNRAVCGEPRVDGVPVPFHMLYVEEIRPWIEDAAQRFAQRCPNIQVKLTAMGSLQAADAILNAEVTPTVWVASDDLVIRYLNYKWKARSSDPLFNIDDMKPLARSPLVMLLWENRFAVLDALGAIADGKPAANREREGEWMQTLCALVPREPGPAEMAIEDMVPGRWIDWYGPLVPPPPKKKPAVAGKKAPPPKPTYEIPFPTVEEIQSWGPVKIAHTSPTRSGAGFEALYLMAFDYLLPPSERTEEDQASLTLNGRAAAMRGTKPQEHLRRSLEKALAERREGLFQWVRRCEAGLEAPPKSADLLTETMFNVGGARYDGVVTYEHLVFQWLRQIDENENALHNMRVTYPQPTIMNQHPAVILHPGDLARQEEIEAAQRWLVFLTSREMQVRAIEYGLRPVTSEVSIRAFNSETNPFLNLRRYGVSFERELKEPPRLSGEAVADLIKLWEDATGRN